MRSESCGLVVFVKRTRGGGLRLLSSAGCERWCPNLHALLGGYLAALDDDEREEEEKREGRRRMRKYFCGLRSKRVFPGRQQL